MPLPRSGIRAIHPGHPGCEAQANGRSAIYHCVSRVVDRQFVLKRPEREQFVKFMRLYEQFCGVKVLKQRFTRGFNKRHARKGTLWEERYKSVLVEDGYTARVAAAYIDLNPVRAGMVEDPAAYRWSSYGAAVGGNLRAREGIASVMMETTTEDRGDGISAPAANRGLRNSACFASLIPL